MVDKLGTWPTVRRGTIHTIAVLVVLTLSSVSLACDLVPSQSPEQAPGETEAVPDQAGSASIQDVTQQIDVEARLHFPLRQELTFERSGEVVEVLVGPGDRVEEGQLLARLDSDHFPILEEEVARLRHQIAEARENIRLIQLDYSGEPVLEAQRKENVARLELANTQADEFLEDIDQKYRDRLTAAMSERDQARVALDAATDALSDAQRDLDANHSQMVAAAQQARAQAELSLDQATDRLTDYRKNLSDDAVRAGDRVTESGVALDLAVDRLEDYKDDLQQNEIRARDRVTKAELALDLAREALQDFLDEHDRRVIRARTVVGAADDALDAAKAPLTQFLRTPIRDVEVDGKPVDVAKLNSLQAAVDLAVANLDKAEEDLAELEEGPDLLRVQELESNVSVAQLNLDQAREELAELEEGPDPVLLQELETSVNVAELNLERSKEDLAELKAGPDILVLNQLQSQVDVARVNVSQATKRLNEALEGPDALILPSLEVNVTLAQRRLDFTERELQELLDDGPERNSVPLMESEIATRLAQIDQLYESPDAVKLAQIEALNALIALALDRMGDIEEEMDEYSLLSPSDGFVYLVNVEEDDIVNKHSRVIELLDPSQVIVKGFIDAGEIQNVATGSTAAVKIDSLPGTELTGVVVMVSEDPVTERGIIRYEVEIQVELPPDQQVPLRLAGVDAAILP
ncbi:MAG: HlyD family efflux transporter periplasmic adaptor subunit [Chloroflexota bacterium]|nr:HlyD family efflux transporter periplasmic adaptor subunit [Chloroflexota bacterium]